MTVCGAVLGIMIISLEVWVGLCIVLFKGRLVVTACLGLCSTDGACLLFGKRRARAVVGLGSAGLFAALSVAEGRVWGQ